MTDQIMAVEKIRLKTQISTLSQTDMLGVEQAILVHLGLPKQQYAYSLKVEQKAENITEQSIAAFDFFFYILLAVVQGQGMLVIDEVVDFDLLIDFFY